MPLDYESAANADPPVRGRFCLVVFGGGVLGFLVWCAADFAYVRFAPFHTHSFDLLLVLVPISVGAAGAVLLRDADASPRISLAILAAILASCVAIFLILFLGISFHFAIGGQL